LSLLVTLTACSPKPDGDSDGDGSTGASDPGTTTGDLSATATGPGTSEPGTTSASGPATSTTADDTTASTTTDATTGALPCDLVELTCARAELDPMVDDCGIVDPWNNTADDWQAARDCALAAVAEQRGFKLVTWLQGIDSDVGVGYAGLAGVTFGVERIVYDSFPPETADLQQCAGLSPTPDCTVEPGEACLTCDDASGGEQLCR
jgi:hypothetical protein